MQRLTDGSRVTESAAYGIIISPGREVVEKRRRSVRAAEMSGLEDPSTLIDIIREAFQPDCSVGQRPDKT